VHNPINPVHTTPVASSLSTPTPGNHTPTSMTLNGHTTPGRSSVQTPANRTPQPSHPTPTERGATRAQRQASEASITPVRAISRTADRSCLAINLSSADSIPSVRLMHSVARSPHSPYSTPVSPRRCHTSPFISSAEFVSPSRSISAEGLLELRRQVNEQLGREMPQCELRYVRTTRTVIEERSICSEVVDNGHLVPGSEKVFQVSGKDGYRNW
jgi:hypothetical protein